MKETKVQIRPLVKISVIAALEELKQKKNKSLGALIEELLSESPTFKEYLAKWKNKYSCS
jgi:hypothetical protein